VIAAIMGGLILLIKEQAFILAETHVAQVWTSRG
jgi:hypothetical protein